MSSTMRERPVIISFVGPSGSGKTAIIEKLIREFGRRGLRVGAVKHSRAGFSLDRSGKDSARFKRAGAGTVLLLSPSSLGLIADYSGTLSPREAAARFFPDADIILVEGWKESALPKILVQGTARRRGVVGPLIRVPRRASVGIVRIRRHRVRGCVVRGRVVRGGIVRRAVTIPVGPVIRIPVVMMRIILLHLYLAMAVWSVILPLPLTMVARPCG
ncbi:MAG: molybdopterin-guanine dinucleotide biosynthesis protein B [Candidatus Aureabacteria bacterium]|nr:molybdopterin-guanine dinucleotide biosynthesis protein B [Candidatus Auribacterota bacterium]